MDEAPVDEREALLRRLLQEKYEPVAIVGLGLRFPGGQRTPEGLAAFLREGRDGTGPIPPERWDVAAFATDDPQARGKILTRGGGFIDGIDQFDARFFNIAPKEAQFIDPQHRLVLECAWEALEHAQIDPHSLKDGDAGVYVGIAGVDYMLAMESLPWAELDGYVGTGTSHSSAAGRVSYFLGLRGPCIALDTACSSSLVTVHLAAQALRRRECSLALAGGINVIHHPRHHIAFTRAHMLAADGRCKTFDDSADGYGRSEGGGMVVLKRLSDALADGDRIWAVLRGSAVAQDGESGGLTVPNGTAQEAVMRQALAAGMVQAQDVSLIEAHGTGTPLGDPIELGAVHAVFGTARAGREAPWVSSVKTNIGHMEAAAGVGGLVKAVLQLNEGRVYPHLHLKTPSTRIPWPRLHLRVPTALEAFPPGPRRAVVNSFGFSGVIASVVLEAPPALPAAAAPVAAGVHLFALSARTPTALAALARAHAQQVQALPDEPAALQAWCRAATVGRAHFARRQAAVVSDRDSLARWLEASAAKHGDEAEHAPRTPWRVAFLCTGQGAQVTGMGRALAARFAAFAQALDDCDRRFAPLLGRSIRALMWGEVDDPQSLHQTLYTQPALFAHAWAAGRLWQSFGVQPTVVIGHSIGELAAAALAGVFTLDDAVRLVAARAQAMQAVTREGGMLAVSGSAQKVAPFLKGQAELGFAAFNTPGQCVISGAREALATVQQALADAGVRCVPLPVSHAFHSVLMREAFEPFRRAFDGVRAHSPQVAVVSNLDGEEAGAAVLADPEHWVRQLAEPVRFLQGMRAVAARGRHLMIELGPCAVLGGLGRASVEAEDHLWIASAHGRVGQAAEDSARSLLEGVARAYEAGLPIRWAAVQGAGGARLRPVTLPGYPFERRRCWLPLPEVAVPTADGPVAALSALAAPTAVAGLATHPLLGRRLPDDADGAQRHEQALSTDLLRLADHAVGDQVVFPAAGHVELVLAAMEAAFGETSRTLALHIHEPLALPAREPVLVQTRLAFTADGGAEVRVSSQAEGRERLHASAVLGPTTAGDAPPVPEATTVPATAESPQAFYARCDALGLHYGPGFRTVQAAWRLDDESVVATLAGDTPPGLALPPPLLDGALQSIALLLGGDITFLPVAIEAFRLHKKPRGPLCSRIQRVEGDPRTDAVLRLDGLLWETTPQGPRVVAHWRGHTLRRLATSAGTAWHLPRWMPRSLPPPAPGANGPGGAAARTLHWLGRGRPPSMARRLAEAAAKAGLAQGTLESPAALPALLATTPAADLVWCWPERTELQGMARVQAEADEGLADLLAWAQALGQAAAPARPVLWVVTAGTQAVRDTTGHGADDALAGATAWGLAAVLANEAPRIRVCRVDVPVGPDGTAEVQGLVDEWLAGTAGSEPQLAFREGRRFVRRVVPAPDHADGANFRLVPPADGQLAHVRAQAVEAADAGNPLLAPPLPDGPPGAGEIQVEVDAAGLNFKDVLNALGMLRQHALATGVPHQPLPLGFEAAGTVLAAGPGAGFAVGEAVLVNQMGAMQRRITVPAQAAVRRPARLSAREAAGQVTAYVTAWYALHHLAGMKAGDRVLIHAAAGGVGQAAVRLALRAGAHVVATASPRKWAAVRRMGVAQVLNSRNTEFAEALRHEGVGQIDLVLNSLNKEFIRAGLSVLAPGGRFVEMGKVGAWSAGQVAAVRPDVAYHHFDLSEVDPAVMQQVNRDILTQVAAALDDGSLSPVATHGHALDELDEAFGVLARGANVGKLVIEFRPPQTHALGPLGADGCVVVTGGFGGLGREVATMLAGAGARRLVLTGRRRPAAEDEAALQARLSAAAQAAGHPPPGLVAVAADVATDAGLQALQQAVAAGGQPLIGVVHAAGVLDDAPLAQLEPSRLGPVLAPKLAGGWRLHRWLHEATRPGAPAPWWIGFSSVAAGFGSPGQGNYAAANAFLDALAGWREARGLPGFSLAWGPFTEAGMAARLSDAQARAVRQRGLRFITPAQGMRWMRELMSSPRPPVPGAQILLGEVDWAQLAGSLAPSPFFDRVAPAAGQAEQAPKAAVDRQALAALPASERALVVNAVLRECIAQALQLDGPDDVAPDAPFSELGLDSLVGVDLVNHLEARFGLSLPNAIIFDAPSVARLTDELLHRLEAAAA